MKLCVHADCWNGQMADTAKASLDKGAGWLKIVNSPDIAYGWAQAYPTKRIVYRKAEPGDLSNLSDWMRRWPDPLQCAQIVADYNAIGAASNLFVEGINEPKVDSLELAEWFGRHEARRSLILRQRGLRAVFGNFATGAISPEHFARFLNVYTVSGGDTQAIIGVHEYGLASMSVLSDGYNMLAHRRLRNAFPSQHLWLITETGCDLINVGGQSVGGGWRDQDISEAQYWAYMNSYNTELEKDGYVLAAFLFTYNGTSRWSQHELRNAPTFNSRFLEATVARSYTRGIDISRYQTVSSWDRVVAAGVQFAYIRNSDALLADEKLALHWSGAKGKLPRGQYQYFRPAPHTGAAQAKFFLDRVDRADLGEMPPMIDVEQLAANPSAFAREIKVWLDTMEAEYKKKPIIYTRKDIWAPLAPYAPWAINYPLWVAGYPYGYSSVPSLAILQTGNLDPSNIFPFGRWKMWQYSSIGYVDGIGYPVDLDVFDGDLLAFRQWAGIEVPAPVYTWQDFINAVYKANASLKYPADKVWDWLFVRAGIDVAAITKRPLAYDGPAVDDLNWSKKEITAYRAAGGKG